MLKDQGHSPIDGDLIRNYSPRFKCRNLWDHDLSISCGKIFEDFALQISEGISPRDYQNQMKTISENFLGKFTPKILEKKDEKKINQ